MIRFAAPVLIALSSLLCGQLPAQLVASFDATPTAGSAPLAVQFTDTTSGGTPTSWLWDFGDGSSSTDPNPLHVYNLLGTYTVSLHVTSPGESDSVASADLIQVDPVGVVSVPGDAATIQAAIDLASNHMEIQVAPGTYTETLDLKGRALTLTGTAGPAQTILDATGFDEIAVLVESGEGPGTMLRGLTIRGGGGTPNLGGGVRVANGSELTIRECVIRDNVADYAGGGLYVADGSQAAVFDTTFLDNTAYTGGGAFHDAPFGALTHDAFRFERCGFYGNTAAGTNAEGGGLRGVGNATDCVFVGNSSVGDDASGGGAVVMDLERCLLVGNSSVTSGGGLLHVALGEARVIDCTFVGNSSSFGGGGAYVQAGTARVEGCVFVDNSSFFDGDGLLVFGLNGGAEIVRNCSFLNDGLRAVTGLELSDSILWGTGAQLFGNIDSVSYTNIPGGWSGVGNTNHDPLYLDGAAGALALLPGSPCVAAASDGGPMGALPLASWSTAGAPLYGVQGLPSFQGSGDLAPLGTLDLAIRRGGPNASATLVIGAFALMAPFKFGVLVPSPNLLVPGLPLDADGSLDLSLDLPNTNLPSGASIWMQVWMPDAIAPAGFSATNGAVVVAP